MLIEGSKHGQTRQAPTNARSGRVSAAAYGRADDARHAKELARVVALWSRLEQMMNGVICQLSGIGLNLGDVFFRSISMPARFLILEGVAARYLKDKDPTLFSSLIKCCEKIRFTENETNWSMVCKFAVAWNLLLLSTGYVEPQARRDHLDSGRYVQSRGRNINAHHEPLGAH